MICTTCYDSPLGKLTLAGKNNKLIGLWIEGQKHFFGNFKDKIKKNDDLAIFRKTEKWLDSYFNGENPSIENLDLNPQGTDFRLKVWKILEGIAYGEVVTYGDIAKKISDLQLCEKSSPFSVSLKKSNLAIAPFNKVLKST